MLRAVCYRVGQFLRALTAGVPEEEAEQAMRILTPEARRLFRRQVVQDQRHALAVYRLLRRSGHADPRLLAAALLHDVGKADARLPAWQRAVIVLLDRFAPRILDRLGQGEPQGRPFSLPERWRRPFVIHARHPQVGARWARQVGCSPLTVALIRRHHDELLTAPCPTDGEDKGEDQWLAALQAADNVS
jgi:hypothetical protein